MLTWIDLIIENDSHPRRFDNRETLRAYVIKMERLSEEAADILLAEGTVGAPVARRTYTIQPLTRQATPTAPPTGLN